MNGPADSALVYRWLWAQSLRQVQRGGTPLWSNVTTAFSVGATSARQICRRHGFDPYQMVRKLRKL